MSDRERGGCTVMEARAHSRPLRIVHLITNLNIGGAELMLTRLVEASDRTRLENTVITLQTGGSLAPRLARAGVPVHDLGLGPGGFDPRALWRLVKLLRRLKPDVLQTWLYHADLVGLLSSFIVRRPKLMWNIRCTELDPSECSLDIGASASSAWPPRLVGPAAVIANSVAGHRDPQATRVSPTPVGSHPERIRYGAFPAVSGCAR